MNTCTNQVINNIAAGKYQLTYTWSVRPERASNVNSYSIYFDSVLIKS